MYASPRVQTLHIVANSLHEGQFLYNACQYSAIISTRRASVLYAQVFCAGACGHGDREKQ